MTLQIELGAAIGLAVTLIGMFGACTGFFCNLLIKGQERRQSERDAKEAEQRKVADLRLAERFATQAQAQAAMENRLEARFKQMDDARNESREELKKRLEGMEGSARALERQFLEFKAELPREYTRREDAIRNETVTQAKIDNLNARVELVLERQGK